MRIYTKLVLGLILVVGLSFVGCKNDGKKSTDKTTTEIKNEKVTIAMVTFPGYAPLYVAKEKGFFKNTNVELRRIESIGDMRAAIKSKNIDVYAATYDIFQSIKGEQPPGVGFLAIDESHGGDGIVVSEGINSIDDFKGKIIGAEPGFPPNFILQYVLHKGNMTLNDVTFKDMASQDAGNAFVAGKLDIAGTYEPYLSISAEKRKGSKVLYSSKDTPGLIVDWLFADNTFLEDNPKALKSIAKGWFEALAFIEKNPEEAYKIMANAYNVDVAEMKDFKTGISWLTLNDNRKMMDLNNSDNAYSTFKQVGDVLENNNETDVRVKAKDKLSDVIIKDIK